MIQRLFILLFSVLLVVALNACSSPSNPNHNNSLGGNTAASSLCVSNSCGSRTVLLTIASAENQVWTDDSRLFVSGGTNVWEITANGGSYLATPIASSDCNFTGLSLYRNYLYANCADGTLFGGPIASPMLISPIYQYSGLSLPNGMATDPQGRIYTVNGPLPSSGLPDPKIVRLHVDPNNPSKIITQEDWLTQSLEFPNGLKYHQGAFYFTDAQLLPAELGAVRKVALNNDGSAGDVETITTWPGILDDLAVLENGDILISDFQNGMVALLNNRGDTLQQTQPATFSSPSSVLLGRPPLFAETDVLVTEKGLLGENDSNVGNVFSVFRAD